MSVLNPHQFDGHDDDGVGSRDFDVKRDAVQRAEVNGGGRTHPSWRARGLSKFKPAGPVGHTGWAAETLRGDFRN